jgi:hypothetical protein
VWVYYPDSVTDEQRGNTLETSGLNITVTDGDGNNVDITETSFAQTEGGFGPSNYSAQFFIETDAEEITIEVTGLVYATRTATFRMTMVDGEMQVGDDSGTDTFQTAPLDGTGNEDGN